MTRYGRAPMSLLGKAGAEGTLWIQQVRHQAGALAAETAATVYSHWTASGQAKRIDAILIALFPQLILLTCVH